MIDARTGESGGGARGAFSLVEVLAAIALFSVAVVVLTAAYVNVLNNIDSVKVDRALEQELEFVRQQVLLEPELENVEEGGDLPTATHGAATWSAVVTPSELVADLFRVDLSIELAGDGDRIAARTVSQSFHVLRPSWSEPLDREKIREQRRKELDEAKRTRPL